jgi:hypothetical protein
MIPKDLTEPTQDTGTVYYLITSKPQHLVVGLFSFVKEREKPPWGGLKPTRSYSVRKNDRTISYNYQVT